MTKCRMCSQRLTRPGKLCRECERELQRARAAAASVDTLSSAIPVIDAGRNAAPEGFGFATRLQSRPAVLVVAFSVGIATAAALYVVRGSHAAAAPESVMIDRDLTHIRPRVTGMPSARPASSASLPGGSKPNDSATRSADNAAMSRRAASASERGQPVMVAIAATASRPAPIALDRVLGLAHALDGCASETLFARIACEHRARMRYCDGAAGRIPQCLEAPPRDSAQ